MRKIRVWGLIALVCLLWLAGCSLEQAAPAKIEDLEFTVVEESQIPEEFRASIEAEKQLGFHLTFDTEEARYIGVGYGAQETGGYSISVDELYLTENAVYISTTLIGPSKGEAVEESESYPYIVVRTGPSDKSVVFE